MPHTSTDRHEFEVLGVQFRIAPLKPLDALEGFRLLGEAITPIVGGLSLESLDPAALRGAFAGFKGLPDLFKLLVARAEVGALPGGVGGKAGDETWKPLVTFTDEAFTGAPERMIGFIIAASIWQFSGFFDAEARARIVAPLLPLLPKNTPSAGESGES